MPHRQAAGGAHLPPDAALEEAEHGDGAAARLWLARAGEAPPDPVFVCASCGRKARLAAGLPRCRAFDSLAWQTPTRAVPALAASWPRRCRRLRRSALIARRHTMAAAARSASWKPAKSARHRRCPRRAVDAGRGEDRCRAASRVSAA